MDYPLIAITDAEVPRAQHPQFQHALDTYASETNKVIPVWSAFTDGQLGYRPDERSSTVEQILRHQLLSERRFLGEFLGSPEPPPAAVLPAVITVQQFQTRMRELAVPRLQFLAGQEPSWWHATVPFFDVTRERIWIFWRRVLHTAHHRTQLTVYLRLLGQPVPATYGPTADVTWTGADPTLSVEAAGRAAKTPSAG